MKIIKYDKLNEKVTGGKQKIYYHYDEDNYDVGDSITKSYTLLPQIIDCYDSFISPIKSQNIVYMLDEPNDDYKEVYEYMYKVSARDVKKVFMDYSPLQCQSYIYRIRCINNLDKIDQEQLEYEEILISLFALAYTEEGDTYKKELKKLFNIESSKKIEYISNNVTVKFKEKC